MQVKPTAVGAFYRRQKCRLLLFEDRIFHAVKIKKQKKKNQTQKAIILNFMITTTTIIIHLFTLILILLIADY